MLILVELKKEENNMKSIKQFRNLCKQGVVFRVGEFGTFAY